MEAALRTAYYAIMGENCAPDAFKNVRASSQETGVTEAEFELNGQILRIAAVSGLGNTRNLLKAIERGEKHYEFVEVMACPGGCVAGAGTMQPVKKSQTAVSLYAAKAGHVTSDRTEYVSELEKLVD